MYILLCYFRLRITVLAFTYYYVTHKYDEYLWYAKEDGLYQKGNEYDNVECSAVSDYEIAYEYEQVQECGAPIICVEVCLGVFIEMPIYDNRDDKGHAIDSEKEEVCPLWDGIVGCKYVEHSVWIFSPVAYSKCD